jgi:L-ascorbate metabolism protein UlaG (beta-lactamase superfamily)
MALHPTTRIRFHGVATYEIITRAGLRILCDPFLDQNPGALVKSDGFDQVDLVVVSHAAFDHLGDTDKIALRYGCPVVCGGEVKAWLMDRGVPAEQIRATTWGIRVKVAGVEIQPLECRHWSQIRLKDGSFISGVPMAYIVYADENVRFYHYGDTAIFSDLKLQAELYRPNIGCIGIANPQEILHLNPMPGEMVTGEMSPYEGVLATEWLGLTTVLPCHYITLDGDADVDAYKTHHAAARARGVQIAEPLYLRPGDWVELDPSGRVLHPERVA